MIKISGEGKLRNNPLENVRALEVAELLLYSNSGCSSWELKYGEIPIGTYRLDTLAYLSEGNKSSIRVGIEIVSKNEEVSNACEKLTHLIGLGEINYGYIYIRPFNELHEDILRKLQKLEGVK